LSFGRRLALFFVLIALVPTLALLGMLVLVSGDSARGKADARLSAGLDTSLALYEGHVADARMRGETLAEDPRLASALAGGDTEALRTFAGDAARSQGVTALEVLGADGRPLIATGGPDALGFAEIELTRKGQARGVLRLATTTAPVYETEIRRLTKRRPVIERDGVALVGTLPEDRPPVGETVEVVVDGNEFRGRLVELDAEGSETLLLMGPRQEGGFLGIEEATAALLIGSLLLGVIFAYVLARTLTRLHAQVAEQAITDPLTGLSNRRRLFQLLDHEMERAKRFGHELSVLIIDIDNFKGINDRYGHPQGDETLRTIADLIRDGTRSIDEPARYGGDELALIMLETGTEGGLVVAERLRKSVENLRVPLPDDQGTMEITISLGLATMPSAALERDALIDAADQALLDAKREGKDRVGVAPARPAEGGETPPVTRPGGERRQAGRPGRRAGD
jgi:diguanylate cyclase (GGDEF)-like protein